jgi:hypothetical protein
MMVTLKKSEQVVQVIRLSHWFLTHVEQAANQELNEAWVQ